MITNIILIIGIFITSFIIWAQVGEKWNSLSSFFHSHHTFFDTTFILLYFFEQLFLLVLLKDAEVSQIGHLIVGIFALIVITTASLQKITWERRQDKIEKLNHQKTTECDQLKEKLEKTKRLYERLSEYNKRISEEIKIKLQDS